MPETLQYATCKHVHAAGHICGSPAMKDHIFCYHHQRDRQRRANLRAIAARKLNNDLAVLAALDLPAPEDPIAASVCISGVLHAMLTGALSGALGGRLLYGLNLAMQNWQHVAAYRREHDHTREMKSASVTVAATDPEPIAPVATDDHSAPAVDSTAYEQALELREVPLPDTESEIADVECKNDMQFEWLINQLPIEDWHKRTFTENLQSEYRSVRQGVRKDVIEYAREALRKLPANAAS